MKIRITQYNEAEYITPNAQLHFFITINEGYQTCQFTDEVFKANDMSFHPDTIQFEYTTP